MRISSVVLRVAIFAVAGVLCLIGARGAVAVVEDRSRVGVQEALLDAGHDWTSVQSDGLQIVLEGTAPNEAVRFRAMSVAGTVVDSSRVIDNMNVAASGLNIAPDFAVEMLRNDSGVSLIGLMPGSTDRDDVARRVSSIADEMTLTDLLDVASYPAPEGWAKSLNFALDALQLLPRSKISVEPAEVSIVAISDSAAQKASWEAELARKAPDGVAITIDISAPRPVITPFTIRLSKDGAGVHMDACAADTPEAQTQILSAVRTLGIDGDVDCPLGLGVPSKTWGDAAVLAISALGELGGGTVTLKDADVSLVAAEGTDPELFDNVVGALTNTLPDVFSLEAELPEPPNPDAAGPPQFTATLSPEGQVQLRGRVADDLMNMTAENYAKARFGQDTVVMATRVGDDGSLPQGWSVRVLAGLEALSHLASGAVVVQPDDVTVSGRTGSKTARDEISRLLITKLGADAAFDMSVTYDEALDPIAALPTPEECVEKIVAVTNRVKITFEPGSDRIVADARGAMDDIADILQKCPELPLKIAGYTDSQGGEEMNQQLSQRRAEAVLDGLRSRRVPVAGFTAIGYGEADPIADNDTAEGREDNRRIEFSLISEEPEEAPEEGSGETEADTPSETETVSE